MLLGKQVSELDALGAVDWLGGARRDKLKRVSETKMNTSVGSGPMSLAKWNNNTAAFTATLSVEVGSK